MNRLTLLIALIGLPTSLDAQQQSRAALDDFERSVRPLLIEKCVNCHGPKKQEAGLRLDSRSSSFAKWDFGTAVIPGNAKASRLIQVIQHEADDVQMPPKQKLPAADIRLLEAWVQSGAAWPDEADPTRYWMDVARYSDTSGYVFTQDRKLGDAWKYRDWLINAFNNDMPINDLLDHRFCQSGEIGPFDGLCGDFGGVCFASGFSGARD